MYKENLGIILYFVILFPFWIWLLYGTWKGWRDSIKEILESVEKTDTKTENIIGVTLFGIIITIVILFLAYGTYIYEASK